MKGCIKMKEFTLKMGELTDDEREIILKDPANQSYFMIGLI